MKDKLVFILGPTASGKSDIAASLAGKINGEIISCDSMQVYKGMEILTQSPRQELLRRIPHHLVGIIPPQEEFDAAKFVEFADSAARKILSSGKIPIFSGGTGLYVKAFLDGIFSSPPKNIEIRERLEEESEKKGSMYLYDKLKKIDPEAARTIDPNNIRRVIRALEVFELTGKTFSKKKTETKGAGDEYEVRLYAMEVSRDVLLRRIEERVERMFESGLIAEVRSLLKKELSLTAAKALGINEVAGLISGSFSLEETKRAIIIKTRQYAKRQMTWLRAVKKAEWVNAERPIGDIALDIAARAGCKDAIKEK